MVLTIRIPNWDYEAIVIGLVLISAFFGFTFGLVAYMTAIPIIYVISVSFIYAGTVCYLRMIEHRYLNIVFPFKLEMN